jgi:lipopolysaccharide exporter
MTESLRQKIIHGGMWSVSLSYLQFVLSFAANIVIARCLGPAPYGPFVILTSLQSAVCLFFIFPLSMAYVRSPGEQSDFDNTWIAGALLGLLCILAGVCGAGVFWIRHRPEMALIFFLLCLAQSPLLLSSIYLATFERHFRFKSSLLITVLCTMAGVLVAVTVGLLHGGIWALFVRETLPSVLIFFAAQHFSDVRFRWTFEMLRVRAILREGFKYWASRSLEQFYFRVPLLAIGAWWGKDFLGNFSQAFYIAQLPNTALGPLTQTVAFPAYSVLDHDDVKFQQAFRAGVFVLLRMALLIGAGFYLLGDKLLHFLYGAKWLLSEPLVVGFWLFAAIAPFFSNVRTACYGRGKQSVVSWAYVLAILALAAMLWVLPHTLEMRTRVPAVYGLSLLVGTIFCFYVSWNDRLGTFLRGLLSARFLFFAAVLLGLVVFKNKWTGGENVYLITALTVLTLAGINVAHESHLHIRR